MEYFLKEIVVVRAWVITTIVLLVLTYWSTQGVETGQSFDLWSIPITTVTLAFCFGVIRYFTGDSRMSKKSPHCLVKIGIWGFIWRFLIAYIVSFQVSAVLSLLLMEVAPFPPLLVMTLLGILLFPLFSCLFFCNERVRKLKQVLSIFRGY